MLVGRGALFDGDVPASTAEPRAATIALLIDAENVRPDVYEPIVEQLRHLGRIVEQRLYGSFDGPGKIGWRYQDWKAQARRSQIQIVDTPALTATGKNAADMTLAIDAMELLLGPRDIDCFAMVSSDSDFTPLAERIRRRGRTVWGFGESETASSFRSACDSFTYIETLLPEGGEDEESCTLGGTQDLLRKALHTLASDGWKDESALHAYVLQEHPDFDARLERLRYTHWQSFLEDIPQVAVKREGLAMHVRLDPLRAKSMLAEAAEGSRSPDPTNKFLSNAVRDRTLESARMSVERAYGRMKKDRQGWAPLAKLKEPCLRVSLQFDSLLQLSGYDGFWHFIEEMDGAKIRNDKDIGLLVRFVPEDDAPITDVESAKLAVRRVYGRMKKDRAGWASASQVEKACLAASSNFDDFLPREGYGKFRRFISEIRGAEVKVDSRGQVCLRFPKLTVV